MVVDLILGLPGQRPGGLLLTILLAAIAAISGLALGLLYATICVHLPRLSLTLQGALAILRGIPLLLLVFALAQLTSLPLAVGGLVALIMYSLCHVGETLRGYLAAYPRALREQSRVLCLGWVREWALLRLPWTLRRSLDALATHWIDMLKDTGALTVLSIGELTTVARVLSEAESISEWRTVLIVSALLYLGATVTLIQLLKLMKRRYSGNGEVTG
jgi:polar amino acid transport system permease protein